MDTTLCSYLRLTTLNMSKVDTCYTSTRQSGLGHWRVTNGN